MEEEEEEEDEGREKEPDKSSWLIWMKRSAGQAPSQGVSALIVRVCVKHWENVPSSDIFLAGWVPLETAPAALDAGVDSVDAADAVTAVDEAPLPPPPPPPLLE